MRGSVEPHTFAKFESLMFYVNLDFDNEDLEPLLRNGKDHRFVVEGETQFGATIRQSDVIWNFVSLLSNSPFIDCLYILVAISLIPDFVFSPRPLTKEEDALLREENLEYKDVVHGNSFSIITCSRL